MNEARSYLRFGRTAVFAAAAVFAGLTAHPGASKAAYPEKTITWVIPFSPGSGADTFARTLIEATQKNLGGVQIVPVNKEGGGTAVGVAYALAQPADGYTLFSQSDTLALSIASGQVPFTADGIQAVARINADYKVLAVNPNSPFKTFQDFVDYAKEHPGGIKIGGVGTKSWSSAFVSKLENGTGVKLTYVPYDGGSKVVSAILGENLDAVVVTSSNVNAQVDSGDIRLLAISLGNRAEDRPDVPTFKESGLTDIDDDLLWRGVFAKKGVPEDILKTLDAAFEKAVTEQNWKDYMTRERQQSVYMPYDKFDAVFKKTVEEVQGRAVKERGGRRSVLATGALSSPRFTSICSSDRRSPHVQASKFCLRSRAGPADGDSSDEQQGRRLRGGCDRMLLRRPHDRRR